MTSINIRLLLVAAAMLLLTAWTSDSDIISKHPELMDAVDEYQLAVTNAREKMLPGFDKLVELAGKNKLATAVERVANIAELERQRDDFRIQGTIPNIPYLERYAKVYQRSLDLAATKLNVPFKKVIKDYIDDGKDAEAAALLRFKDELVVGDGFKLIGRWQLVEGVGGHGFSEVFDIRKDNGKWSIERSFYGPSGSKTGGSSAKEIVFLNGVLSYTDYFVKKPKSEWHDKADFTVQVDDKEPGRLKAQWTIGGGQTDVLTLVPVK